MTTQVTVYKLTQSQAASQLSAAGVTWSSSGGCTTRSNSTCTSFEQINDSSPGREDPQERERLLDQHRRRHGGGPRLRHLQPLQRVQGRHHAPDLCCVDGYIHSAFTRIANRGDGARQWKAGSGNIYADEGSHWDITYYSCGC